MHIQRNKYWHLQMHLPFNRGEEEIDPVQMLRAPEPVIGMGEREDCQGKYFKYEMKSGDVVLVRKGNHAIALCKVIGENFTDKDLAEKYLHRNFRKVKILSWAESYEQPPSGLFAQGTLQPLIDKTKPRYKYINNWLKYMERKAFLDICANLLKSKRNIILQGAPGTGKTYNTAAIALDLLGINDVDLTDHAAVMNIYEELTDKRIFFTTFHQSLDYEDFVEGLKPHVQKNDHGESKGVTYEPEDGIFKLACNAANDSGKPVVLIIDEINRGNVSKIFGELITLLESDKRIGKDHPVKVKLPYSKHLFGVPDNLYIIGTMNTTDRSTGTLDYALRRRFAFVTLQSDPEIIKAHYDRLGAPELKATATKLFADIKSFITSPKHICGDWSTDDLMVGHSYFMAASEEELRNKVDYEILPLIAEYISDGIITVSDKEKKNAFRAWSQLQPANADKDLVSDPEDPQ